MADEADVRERVESVGGRGIETDPPRRLGLDAIAAPEQREGLVGRPLRRRGPDSDRSRAGRTDLECSSPPSRPRRRRRSRRGRSRPTAAGSRAARRWWRPACRRFRTAAPVRSRSRCRAWRAAGRPADGRSGCDGARPNATRASRRPSRSSTSAAAAASDSRSAARSSSPVSARCAGASPSSTASSAGTVADSSSRAASASSPWARATRPHTAAGRCRRSQTSNNAAAGLPASSRQSQSRSNASARRSTSLTARRVLDPQSLDQPPRRHRHVVGLESRRVLDAPSLARFERLRDALVAIPRRPLVSDRVRIARRQVHLVGARHPAASRVGLDRQRVAVEVAGPLVAPAAGHRQQPVPSGPHRDAARRLPADRARGVGIDQVLARQAPAIERGEEAVPVANALQLETREIRRHSRLEPRRAQRDRRAARRILGEHRAVAREAQHHLAPGGVAAHGDLLAHLGHALPAVRHAVLGRFARTPARAQHVEVLLIHAEDGEPERDVTVVAERDAGQRGLAGADQARAAATTDEPGSAATAARARGADRWRGSAGRWSSATAAIAQLLLPAEAASPRLGRSRALRTGRSTRARSSSSAANDTAAVPRS